MRLFKLNHRLSIRKGTDYFVCLAEFERGEVIFEIEPVNKNMFVALTSKGIFKLWYRTFAGHEIETR